MEEFMTPVLPVTFSSEQDKPGPPPPPLPPPPAEPFPFLNGAATRSGSFRDALRAMLQAHDAEISLLQQEVTRLQHKCDVKGTACQQPCESESRLSRPLHVTGQEEASRADETDKLGDLPCQVPVAGVDPPSCSPAECKTSSSILQVDSGATPAEALQGTNRFVSYQICKSNDVAAFSQKKQSTALEPPQEFIPRRSTLVSGLGFGHAPTDASAAVDDEFNLLQQWEKNWFNLVSALHSHSQLHSSRLHDIWTLTGGHLCSKTQEARDVDIWRKVVLKKKRMRRDLTFDRVSSQRRDTFELDLRYAIFGDGDFVHRCIAEFHAHGFTAFMEKYTVITPHSRMRLSWIGVGMALIFYDVVVVPLQSFDLKEEGGFFTFMRWFQALYWLGDLVLTFFTAVYVDVELVSKLSLIAYRYARSWLSFDLIVMIPIWLEIFLSSGDMQALRSIRMLRFFRLVRLAKFAKLLDEQLKAIHSPFLMLLVKLLQLELGLVMFVHVNACLWHYVGKQKDGWASLMADTDSAYKYVAAVHWALTQFQGTSEINPGKSTGERVYAAVAVLFSLIIACLFLSNLTNIIVQIQSLTAERDRQIWDICEYMNAHNIPRPLTMRIRNFLLWKAKADKRKPSEAFRALPERIVMELEFEIHHPTISQHDFFGEFTRVYPRLSRRVFHHALQTIYMSPADSIFAAEESSNSMYFVMSGNLEYAVILRRADEMLTLEREPVGSETTLSEPALWMQWQHKGTCVAETYCHILGLSAEGWRKVVPTHPPALLSCHLYARRLVAGMARCYWKCTDIVIPAQLIAEEETFLEALLGLGTIKKDSTERNTADSSGGSANSSVMH